MTKFTDWPLWLQLSVGVPHALLAGFLAWVGDHYAGEAFTVL